MTRSPIPKALSIIFSSPLKALLMGGQACILYGAAEFSRDIDIAVLLDSENLDELRAVLADCGATQAYVPALSADALQQGHACHFRCRVPDLDGLRIDVMTRMRGVDPFPRLWERRRIFELPEIGSIAVMALSDLVQAKKTQRDKDWPMIRRLIEADIHQHGNHPSARQVLFWLRECRTPDLLRSLVQSYPEEAASLTEQRPLLKTVHSDDITAIERHLRDEEEHERALDRAYWQPLKEELERLRHERPG